ncbi:2-oxoglutarate receptor 1-like [Xenia sp. Carnegie-2017]|uniref:2-oxoglutarate receptor 1-like n=1 Tax=Xenia sp. Carnegie-2017 TaxID=2897299 RepID=UPI001F04D356|nr:2-oxoglutarate receptor 1-like [Xenia sp. Carnegie-2017]
MNMKSLSTILLFLGITLIRGANMPTRNATSPIRNESQILNNDNVSINETNISTSKKEESRFFSHRQLTILLIITVSIAVLGALLNSAVILAMIFDPLKILRKGPWITILNLAIADLLSCVFCFLDWTSFPIFKIFYLSNSEIKFVAFGWSFSTGASFLFLTFFSVQIFFLTMNPLKRRFTFTTSKVFSASVGIWLFSIPIGFCYVIDIFQPVHDQDHSEHIKFWVIRIAFLHFLTLVQLTLNMQVVIKIIRSRRNTEDDCIQNNKHRNIAKTVVILTAILFITTFPFLLLKQIEFVSRMNKTHKSKFIAKLGKIVYLFYPVLIINFVANPILYSLRLRDFRRSLLALIGKIRGNNAHIHTNNISFRLSKRSSMNSSTSQKSKATQGLINSSLLTATTPV